MQNQTDLLKLSTAWKHASQALLIRFESPYLLEDSSGNNVPCVGYLPDFGGPKGMVIGYIHPPGVKTNPSLKSGAKARDLFYSFINLKVYEKYDEEVFKEALLDWGFFGDETMRPLWMK